MQSITHAPSEPQTMMFLLRMAFWLIVVSFFVPMRGTGETTSASVVKEAVSEAHATYRTEVEPYVAAVETSRRMAALIARETADIPLPAARPEALR